MAEWQPIETAPKDGTPVLIFDVNGCGYYGHAFAVGHQERIPNGWIWRGYYDGLPPCDAPTHWMPLPAPPAL